MDKSSSKQNIKVHLSGIDEFLAERYLNYKSAFELSLKNYTADGFVLESDNVSLLELDSDGVDFELSTCECQGLSDTDLFELVKKPIYTSSPYEFFDAYLPVYGEISCWVNIVEGSWLIKVLL